MSQACIFVGYSEGSKAYRVFNNLSKKVFVSRDVIFLRSKTPSEPEDNMEESELIIQKEPIEADDASNDAVTQIR